jgi:pimeloyl-ACP methyl ester carboxylesterase
MKKSLLFISLITFFIGFSQTPITATIAYQGYDETQAFLGQGEYQIFLDNVNGVLDKPIILVDGFDPGDTRNIADLYAALDYDSTNIADILRDEGFDLVLLNFPTYTRASDQIEVNGGADYIQRNAMILTELISQINNQKVGNEELVIIGPSMGGLISRYALRYMEQNSLTHETRLFISWDSPHKGANIPIELQYLMNYFAEVNNGDADLQAALASSLGSPAAKEMLIDHYSTHIEAGSAYEQDPSLLLPMGAVNFRDAFQTEIDAMGFPQQTRNIAIANGSGIGSMSGTPGMEILNHTFDVPNVDNATIDIILHFTPESNQTIEVTNTNTRYFGATIATFIASAQSFSYTDGLDSAPGGMTSLEVFFGGAQDNSLIAELIDNLQQSNYCFIPTISAMAIDNENDWYASVDIPTVHNSPFVAWYIPTENEYHVTPTAANVAFTLQEIRNGQASVIDTNFDSLFKVKSNPVSTEITMLTNSIYNTLEVSIISLTGKKLTSKQFTDVNNEISLPINLSNGIYFLKVDTNNKSCVKKIIVNN